MAYIKKSGNKYIVTNEGKKESNAPQTIYKDSKKDRIKFWKSVSNEISWIKNPTKDYIQKGPRSFTWFEDGQLNLCYNAVDRHLDKPDKTAIVFVPENPKEKKQVISYFMLYKMVNQAASNLIKQGLKKGDIVTIYLPLLPETLAYMLACTRIGAIHSVVFSAYSADALRTRIKDNKAKLLITADYYNRKGKPSNLIKKANEAIKGIKIKKIILKREQSGKMLNDNKPEIIKPANMNSEDTIFILYTSGTTGKPKGVMHATAGYTIQAYASCKYVFNLKENETIWCTADIGWITGHTYACYGPLLNGATTVIYEGLPNYPTIDRYLKIIEENNVNVFYTAPTALRMFAKEGTSHTKKHKLKSLKILGSVGEPIDQKTWEWFYKNIGKSNCPIVDTYWQTETGSAVIATLPGIGPFVPSYAGKPFPGMDYDIVNEKGKTLPPGKKGLLIQRPPFNPSLIRGVWKNEKKYKGYFMGKFYLAGDNAFKTSSGDIRVLGRSDDVIKVAGHRMSTAEIENAIANVKGVIESVIVGKPDEIRGEIPVAFVRTKPNVKLTKEQIVGAVLKGIGPIAKPHEVYFVKDIPKTRSGKMMRRILKALLLGEPIKNTSTMVNPQSVKDIEILLSSK